MNLGAFSPLCSQSPSTESQPVSTAQSLECRVRRSYTVQYKLDVVKWVEERGSSLRQAEKHFGITRRVIRTWLEQRDQLREAMNSSNPNKRKLHSGRRPVSQELDRRVLEYLVKQRSRQTAVSDSELRSKALEVGHHLGVEGFKANLSWLKRWKQRCGVDYRNRTNNIASLQDKPAESAFLSHLDSSEQIKLTVQHSAAVELLDITQISQSGPLYFDFSTSEHNYCQKAHQPSMFIASTLPGQLETNVEELYSSHGLHCHQLGSEQDISTLAHASEVDTHLSMAPTSGCVPEAPPTTTPHPPNSSPAVGSVFDVMIPSAGSVVQELVESLELPLGHEEVVGESNNAGRDGELIITQAAAISPTFHRYNSLLADHSFTNSQEQVQSYFASTTSASLQTQPLLSASFARDSRLPDFVSLQSAQDYLIEMSSFLQEPSVSVTSTMSSSIESSPGVTGAKQVGGKKRFQPKRGCSKTKTKNAKRSAAGQRRGRAVTPVATFPNLMLDDPQGYSGMVASRLSQPVFPGEPEFVYTDMATSH